LRNYRTGMREIPPPPVHLPSPQAVGLVSFPFYDARASFNNRLLRKRSGLALNSDCRQALTFFRRPLSFLRQSIFFPPRSHFSSETTTPLVLAECSGTIPYGPLNPLFSRPTYFPCGFFSAKVRPPEGCTMFCPRDVFFFPRKRRESLRVCAVCSRFRPNCGASLFFIYCSPPSLPAPL